MDLERGQKIMMDKLIDTPWLLRITALVLAVMLFFVVRPDGSPNDVDSTASGMNETVLEDVPVELRYDDSNFVVTGVPQTVDVKIKGPVGIVITTQTGRNYKVVLNVKDKPTGEHKINFQAEGFSDKLTVEVDPKSVNVKVEERITKDVRVEPEINESQIASGRYVKSMTTEPQTVTVSGAKSAIESINYVKATVSADKDVSKTFEKSAGVKIFDRDLNILNVDVEPKTVKVKVEIAEYNREVPVVVNQKGKPAKNYTVSSLEPKTKKILIYGSQTDIDQIQAITVDADVSDLKKSATIEGKIQLPKGVTSTSVSSIDVKATIAKDTDDDTDEEAEEVESESTTTEDDVVSNTTDSNSVEKKTFKNINIQLSGMDTEQFEQQFLEPKTGQIDIDAEGEEAKIADLTKADINAFVDASKVEEGTQELPVQIKGPDGIAYNPSFANVKIKFTKQAS